MRAVVASSVANMFPPPDLTDVTKNHEEMQHIAYMCLMNLSNALTPMIQRCIDEDDAFNEALTDMEQLSLNTVPSVPQTCVTNTSLPLRALYDAWLDCVIINAEHVFTVHERHTMAMHVFTELLRLHWLLHRESLLQQQYALVCDHDTPAAPCLRYAIGTNNRHPMWTLLRASFEGSHDAEETQVQVQQLGHIWTRPIMTLTQSEIVHVVLFLTQQVIHTPSTPDAIAELRRTTELVMLRLAILTQETQPDGVLDDARFRGPPGSGTCNEAFIAFTSFYMLSLLRRFFYLDLIPLTPLTPTEENLSALGHQWVQRIVDTFAEEAAEDVYLNQIEAGYAFPGDERWFRYAFPQRVYSRGACITQLRPHLHKRFFSEDKLNTRVILSSTATSTVARLFVLAVVDEYVRMHATNGATEWHQAVIVFNHEIESSALVVRESTHPYLMQVFSSSFWLYDDGAVVLVTDDIYLAVAAWFYTLHHRHGAIMLQRDLSRFTRECLNL